MNERTTDQYALLLRRLQLTCTAWVESLNIKDDRQGGEHLDDVKNTVV